MPWQDGAGGYVATPLAAYDEEPGLDRRSEEHAVPRFASRTCARPATPASSATRRRRARPTSSSPNMVAEAVSGSKTPKEAAERAQKRAERYYKV